MPITIMLNGQRKELETTLNLEQFLTNEGFAEKKVAVAKNGEFIPRIAYKNTPIDDDDEIEIVAPMQGG